MHVITYLFKPTESTTPRVSPDVNRGLRVTGMRLCRLISCNKCIPLVRDVDSGGRASMETALTFLLSVAVNLELL